MILTVIFLPFSFEVSFNDVPVAFLTAFEPANHW